MKTLRAHGFSQRPRFEQVVGYLERNEPLPLDQPDRKATTFVTSHFYLDDFVQSSEDPNPQRGALSELLDLSGLSAAAASSQRQEEPVLHGGHPSQRA